MIDENEFDFERWFYFCGDNLVYCFGSYLMYSLLSMSSICLCWVERRNWLDELCCLSLGDSGEILLRTIVLQTYCRWSNLGFRAWGASVLSERYDLSLCPPSVHPTYCRYFAGVNSESVVKSALRLTNKLCGFRVRCVGVVHPCLTL